MSYVLSKRVQQALFQEAKKNSHVKDVRKIVEKLSKILSLCGEVSHARKTATRIGGYLLRGHTKIIVPVCPDYSHKNGIYTFRELGSGVSLLAQKHVVFLRRMQEVFPDMHPIFLIANLESQDDAICKAVGVSADEFTCCLWRSLIATREMVSEYGWETVNMTDFISDIKTREDVARVWIDGSANFLGRITAETLSRIPMYQKINSQFSIEEMRKRTIRTAAQYIALGRFAVENSLMVCNHTTVNLSWYLQAGTATLHNSIYVY